jgi:hypothetical protein
MEEMKKEKEKERESLGSVGERLRAREIENKGGRLRARRVES